MRAKHVAKQVLMAVLVIVFASLASQPAEARTLGDFIDNTLDDTGDYFRYLFEDTFDQGIGAGIGYGRGNALDFVLFFILFTVVFLIGLRIAFAEHKEVGRQLTVFALTAGLMSSIALVYGLGMSIIRLRFLALGLLYFILVILVYALLLRVGLENHKIIAFILAVIITLLFFLLGAAMLGDGLDLGFFRGGGRGDISLDGPAAGRDAGEGWFSRTFGGIFRGKDAGKEPEAELDTCSFSEEQAFEQSEKNTLIALKPDVQGKLEAFLGKCQNDVVIKAYHPQEMGIASLRASAVKTIINEKKPGMRISTEQEVREGSNGLDVTCSCWKSREEDSELLPTCKSASEFNFPEAFRDAKKSAQRLVDPEKVTPEIRQARGLMEQCEDEYQEKKGSDEEGQYHEYYSEKVRIFYTMLGRQWWENEHYTTAAGEFRTAYGKEPAITERAQGELGKTWYQWLNSLYETWLGQLSGYDAVTKGYVTGEILKDILLAEEKEINDEFMPPSRTLSQIVKTKQPQAD